MPARSIEQARRLIELLDVQSYVAFDKTNRGVPNAIKYPPRALHEAMINALAHRDYEINEPTCITKGSDRIEVLSPGPLPTGISEDEFRPARLRRNGGIRVWLGSLAGFSLRKRKDREFQHSALFA